MGDLPVKTPVPHLAAGVFLAVFGLVGCSASGPDAKPAQDAASTASSKGASSAPAKSSATGATTGTTKDASAAPAPSASTSTTPGELPLRDDGTIDPAKFEELVTGHTIRTLIQKEELFQDGVAKPVSTYQNLFYIKAKGFTYASVEEISPDGTRTPVAYQEYKTGAKTDTYWRYEDGKWGKPEANTVKTKYAGKSPQHMVKVEPDGPNGIKERRFRIEYTPLPDDLGGKEASVTKVIATYNEQWMEIIKRIDIDEMDYHMVLTTVGFDKPITFPKPPQGAHLEPAEGVSIRK